MGRIGVDIIMENKCAMDLADNQISVKCNNVECNNCKFCYTSTKSIFHSRHCFMTGAYCSKQANIHREQQQFHNEGIITAFVVMNFSDMSDVVYQWRIKTFIESLSKYLFFDGKKERLYCSANEVKKEPKLKIRVVRSDTAPASNYVICSRICQQMQIADIVIVDVSVPNANVFYEFGMAIALGKLVLPICYSESFYKRTLPPEIKNSLNLEIEKQVEHHIGCYPWRKDLFEYYGIRYKYSKSKTCYGNFDTITNEKYGFLDINYARFPYHEPLEGHQEIIGKEIYNRLQDEYNNASDQDNTLVVYTMDAFLNEEQAGLCIINFYRGITARMRQEHCFCGERIGVLVQGNAVQEEGKDSKSQVYLAYSVGEIVQIGLNQATYLTMKDRIDIHDGFIEKIFKQEDISRGHRDEIERFIKGYVYNKGIRIYPNYPVFVDRMKNLLHGNILDSQVTNSDETHACCNMKFFCLYHVMLRTLRYTNEIVVDISNNCLQTLFWLGAAHGLDVHAITVKHEKTEKEKESSSEKESRYIFDVAGLWTAIFRKNDTEGFYQQLALAQYGIERQSKLMLPDSENRKKELEDCLSTFYKDPDATGIKNLMGKRDANEKEILESYYRTHFWMPMLSDNHLKIYISHSNTCSQNEPRIRTAKWDFDAISKLSNYLSKRKIIGEYILATLDEDISSQACEKETQMANFICVGSFAQPLGQDGPGLSDYISKRMPKVPVIHKWVSRDDTGYVSSQVKMRINGFCCIGDSEKGYYTHIPQIQLKEFYQANPAKGNYPRIIHSIKAIQPTDFAQDIDGTHNEIAQLILWREDSELPYGDSHYWVSLIGSSGPATLALSAILTDEEQKQHRNMDSAKDFLCTLQSEARKQLVKNFHERLTTMLKDVATHNGWNWANDLENRQINEYFVLVKYAVMFYLQTVLYRYFFPFLTPNDMERIQNGMYTVVNSMKAAKISPFALEYAVIPEDGYTTTIPREIVEEIIDRIPKVLRSVLQDFKGLEAFYCIKVCHNLNSEGKDTRRILDIDMLKENGESDAQIVNCFIDQQQGEQFV